ncbi:hypothetical protein T484DRAFT_2887180 [Baffinella frigidus]|nr:hypothetical protein T484DRAFT_2887180 [Cryptophyta sp. CCMP2293]
MGGGRNCRRDACYGEEGGEDGSGLLEAMQRRAMATAGEFKPQGVANLLWALASMSVRKGRGHLEGLVEAMQMRATATAGEFKPAAVANVLWALAKMGMGVRADPGLLEAMLKRAAATTGAFNPPEVAGVLWGLATMGVRPDPGLLEAMQRQATATAKGYTPQGVASVLWALATMGERIHPGLLGVMQRRVMATAADFEAQGVATVLWALATTGVRANGTLVALMDRLAARVLQVRGQLDEKAKCQIHQWLLACELGLVAGASLSSGVARVKQEIGEACLQAFSGLVTCESWLQREVAAALRSGGAEVEIEEEYRDVRSGYSIDVLVRRRSAAGSTEWAVEVDGPFHFLLDGTPDGSTLLKRKQLGQLGYTVVPVPFWEWNALRGEEAKWCYLAWALPGLQSVAGDLSGQEGRPANEPGGVEECGVEGDHATAVRVCTGQSYTTLDTLHTLKPASQMGVSEDNVHISNSGKRVKSKAAPPSRASRTDDGPAARTPPPVNPCVRVASRERAERPEDAEWYKASVDTLRPLVEARRAAQAAFEVAYTLHPTP